MRHTQRCHVRHGQTLVDRSSGGRSIYDVTCSIIGQLGNLRPAAEMADTAAISRNVRPPWCNKLPTKTHRAGLTHARRAGQSQRPPTHLLHRGTAVTRGSNVGRRRLEKWRPQSEPDYSVGSIGTVTIWPLKNSGLTNPEILFFKYVNYDKAI